jgi:hypothetical protein
MTGTGAGVMPIVRVGESVVGDGVPGPITQGFVEQMRATLASSAYGIPLSATPEEIERYLAGPGALPEESERYRLQDSTLPSPEYA